MYTAISNNVVVSKHKARRQDRKVMWDFFLNKFIKTSYASPVQWRFTTASHLDERNFMISSRWSSSCFEDGKSEGSSSLSWIPFSCTRKYQWAVFSSCVNWLVNLSSVEGSTNENVTWKCNFILFVLLIGITLTRLTSTETANYPVKLVGVALKLWKLNEKVAVMYLCSQQNLEFGHFTLIFAEDGNNEMWQNLKHMCKTVVSAH